MKTYKDVIMDYAQHNNLSLEKREELFKDFHLYNAETGWQDWMNDYTSANDGEPTSEAEINLQK